MSAIFDLGERPAVAIHNSDDVYPVRRIYCVGRNYEAHAREMGKDPQRDPPFFFTKPADSLVANGVDVPYPPRTENFHHEIELVIAIGKGGRDINVEDAEDHIYGYAVGNDLTRRDLQLAAREQGRPWDTGKAFDLSAPITAIYPVADNGHIREGEISIKVNGEIRQQADIKDLIWNVPEIVAELSTLFELQPGDLIYTGTPAGVGAVERGDLMEGYIAGLGTLTTRVSE
ncbi:fumarylacetoacetate hydrolase family protein [Pseudomaricurvus alkylphenolicus]|uniref:fumarylacetoacetate hydrolase family protein n=1 Tax=Pseudomaricurvus alkylphenolicus TaxID=1306991 RepID=UPI001420077D|nr:fumarylacetoacetate hydrolase family protein [Pseudomaricurvus alkylphenolicus]NIB38255.1 fumarylacetoacetate hydrolase family protein [Pseudomaricurvus alkylphenolicus]